MLAVLLLASAATLATSATTPEYELVFEDEFFGGALDTSAWSVEIDCLGGGNLERQCYMDAPANVRVVPFAEGDDAGRDHLAGDGYTFSRLQAMITYPQVQTFLRCSPAPLPAHGVRYGCSSLAAHAGAPTSTPRCPSSRWWPSATPRSTTRPPRRPAAT